MAAASLALGRRDATAGVIRLAREAAAQTTIRRLGKPVTEQVYAHFIGAGGAGMSGIALVLAERGVRVTGSDLKQSRYSRALEGAGIPMAIGHAAENLGDPQVVVVSSAIPERNPELAEARARGLEVWPRAKMLAHLAEERRDHRRCRHARQDLDLLDDRHDALADGS